MFVKKIKFVTVCLFFPFVLFRQVFEIYDALSDPSVNVMNDVIRGAVNLCSGCYIVVGIFGYIAFCGTTEVGGMEQSSIFVAFY